MRADPDTGAAWALLALVAVELIAVVAVVVRGIG